MESSGEKPYLEQAYQPIQSPFLSAQPEHRPPLPPRPGNSSASSLLEPPPAHGKGKISYHSEQFDRSLFLQDPRSASTQSLVPAERSNGKRTLLLIYLHGFLGRETSFHSFPAHVHNLVTLAVAKTHVVHTKIYPRYRSRRAIEHARDDFSSWLHPNESADTDVVLLGHSMGGILSAEVALLSSPSPDVFGSPQFRHRILGTISFDCPFLGMHPGIVFSGIESLFRPAPSSTETQVPHSDSEDQFLGFHGNSSSRASSPSRTPLPLSHTDSEVDSGSGAPLVGDENFHAVASKDFTTQESTTDTSLHAPASDPNYDPPFPNDIRLPERKGWDSAMHFISKHSHDLAKAATAYVTSHLEFGACVADYKGLENRYTKLRPLEDIKPPHEGARRVRFLNYYTICNGRPKKSKPVAEGSHGLHPGMINAQNTARRHSEHQLQGLQNASSSTLTTQSPLPSPRISVEEHRDGEVYLKIAEDFEALQLDGEESASLDEGIVSSNENLADADPGQTGPVSSMLEPSTESALTLPRSDNSISLPPLPSFPEAPQRYDPATYSDRQARNLAHKQYSAEFKSYMRALKTYNQAISDRLKSIEKQEKNKEKSKKISKSRGGKKTQSSTKPAISPLEPEGVPGSPSPAKPSEGVSHGSPSPQDEQKAPKERRFCILPPRINGQRDSLWVQVFMKDVDEVGAHCGLFVPGEHYAWLTNDVGTRIRSWVEEM